MRHLLICSISLFSIHSLKCTLWSCDIMNCIKLLLISCQIAERWITVRGLSYICHWPLSTSVELSTPWRPIIVLLIQLVMLHTWQLLSKQCPDRVITELTRQWCSFQSPKIPDCQQQLVLITVNARILQNHASRTTHQHISAITAERHPSVVTLHSLHAALQGLALGKVLWEFVAAGAELEGLLHLLEQLLVVAERDPFGLSFNSSP